MVVENSLLVAVLALGPALPLEPAPSQPAPQPRVLRPSFSGFDRGEPEAVSKRDATAADLGLVPLGDGYRYRGSKEERFDAIIERDGTVRFELDPKVRATIDGVCLSGACKLTKQGRKHHGKTRRRKRGARAAMTVAALLAEAATGTMTVGSTPWGYGTPVSGPIPGSSLGVPPPIPIATAVGRYGYLPAPAIGMSQFMDRTFALRLEMKVEAARDDLAAAGRAQRRRLEQLWEDPTLDHAARRAAILAMWSDTDPPAAVVETKPSDGDVPLEQAANEALLHARREAATKARAEIIRSVGEHAAKGSAAGFSEVELRRFNRGKSVAERFAPYAPRAESVPGVGPAQ